MIWKGDQDRLVGLDRVVEAVFLDVTFRAIQLLDDIHTHAGLNNFLCEVTAVRRRSAIFQVKKHYILSRRRAPNLVPKRCSKRQSLSCAQGIRSSVRTTGGRPFPAHGHLWHTE